MLTENRQFLLGKHFGAGFSVQFPVSARVQLMIHETQASAVTPGAPTGKAEHPPQITCAGATEVRRESKNATTTQNRPMVTLQETPISNLQELLNCAVNTASPSTRVRRILAALRFVKAVRASFANLTPIDMNPRETGRGFRRPVAPSPAPAALARSRAAAAPGESTAPRSSPAACGRSRRERRTPRDAQPPRRGPRSRRPLDPHPRPSITETNPADCFAIAETQAQTSLSARFGVVIPTTLPTTACHQDTRGQFCDPDREPCGTRRSASSTRWPRNTSAMGRPSRRATMRAAHSAVPPVSALQFHAGRGDEAARLLLLVVDAQ